MAWTQSQQIALAVVPKFSSILSLLGSTWILVEVLTGKGKLRQVYNRLLGMMALYDILESVWNFASTWPIPRGTQGVWGASGTTATCAAQGFFLQFSLGVPIYNACLSIYYLLIIRYGISEERIQRYIEPSMHVIVFLISGGTAFASAGLNLLNNANLWCWIAPYPLDCKDSLRYGDEANCIRGDNAWLYRWLFYFIPLWTCIAISIVATFMFYCSVKKREHASLQYRQPTLSHISMRNSYCETGSIRISSGDLMGNGSGSIRNGSNELLNNRSSTQGKPNEESAAAAEEDLDGSLSNNSSWRASMRAFVAKSVTRRRGEEQPELSNPRSKEVWQQAIFFTFAFWMTHLFSTMNRTVQLVRGDTFYVLVVLHSWFDPLQGFTNFIIYRRPRYTRYRKRKNAQMTRWEALTATLRWTFMGPPKPKIAKEPEKKESTLDSKEEDERPQEEEEAAAPAEAPATLQPIVEISEEFSRVAPLQKLGGTPRTVSALESTSESAEHDAEGHAEVEAPKTASSDTASDITKHETTEQARLEAEKLEEKRNQSVETEAGEDSQS